MTIVKIAHHRHRSAGSTSGNKLNIIHDRCKVPIDSTAIIPDLLHRAVYITISCIIRTDRCITANRFSTYSRSIFRLPQMASKLLSGIRSYLNDVNTEYISGRIFKISIYNSSFCLNDTVRAADIIPSRIVNTGACTAADCRTACKLPVLRLKCCCSKNLLAACRL